MQQSVGVATLVDFLFSLFELVCFMLNGEQMEKEELERKLQETIDMEDRFRKKIILKFKARYDCFLCT